MSDLIGRWMAVWLVMWLSGWLDGWIVTWMSGWLDDHGSGWVDGCFALLTTSPCLVALSSICCGTVKKKLYTFTLDFFFCHYHEVIRI